MLNSAFQTIEKQKKFTDSIAEEFANAFIRQTAKLVKIVKVKDENQKSMHFQLIKLLNKPKL